MRRGAILGATALIDDKIKFFSSRPNLNGREAEVLRQLMEERDKQLARVAEQSKEIDAFDVNAGPRTPEKTPPIRAATVLASLKPADWNDLARLSLGPSLTLSVGAQASVLRAVKMAELHLAEAEVPSGLSYRIKQKFTPVLTAIDADNAANGAAKKEAEQQVLEALERFVEESRLIGRPRVPHD